MTMRRMFMMAAGAVLPVAVIALLFDNQWVVDAIRESDFEYDEGVGPLVSWAQTLSWRLYPADGMEWSYVLISDFAVLLFFVLLGAFVVGAARVVDPDRGPLGAVIIGWWAAILAGAISGLVYGPLAHWTLDFPSASRIIFSSISQGAVAGTAFGWIAGLGALAGFTFSGARTGARQPQGSQLQYPQRPPFAPQQPGMPMQQPGMPQQQMPQQPMHQQPMHQQMPPGMPQPPMQQPHPSAVPYVPPQGQPQQQPQWGAAPVPQQPGAPAPQQPGAPVPQQPGTPVPQQFGAPPVPPQQPAQPAQAPAAAEPSEPETAADDPEASDPGTSGPAAGSGAEPEPPADTPEDDDLDLADRTIVDRGRTED
ncbi:hypothetical protein E1264_09890 [Actinomadura sp. KC216]|uniref:hypothetical protein n=1 Tax=Actinomadura sp. KC216 TaxID=2530370 RepID=UPI00104FE6E8|nr:hypothetical protein [Actinomadura sp. KC216]TDB88891.1 hypothetical protein E1264_09890 [Actinomadura sp. KC216]